MKKTFATLALVLSSAASLSAAESSLALGVVRTQASSNIISGELADDFGVSSDSTLGVGIEFRHAFTPALALEASGSWSESELEFASPQEPQPQSLGELRSIPLRLLLVAQAPLGRLTPFIGAGAQYTLLELTDRDLLDDRGTEDLDLEDEVSWVAKAGVDITITPAHAVTLSATHAPVDTQFTATDRDPLDVTFDELTWFAGIRTKF